MHPRSRSTALAAALLAAVALVAAPTGARADHGGFHVLVFSKTTGYRHASIPAGIDMLTALGAEHGFEVVATDDAAAFSDAGLAGFQVVVFNNANADAGPLLDAEQRAAFKRWVNAGGGFVGIHAASNAEPDWSWYGALVGATFAGHAPFQRHEVKVADRRHPSTAHLPSRWVRMDEPYSFTTNPTGTVHVLATVDRATYTEATGSAAAGGDHPVAWCHEFEGGRSWYTGQGHDAAAYRDPSFRQHVLGGVMWAAGAVPGDCSAGVERNFEKVALDRDTDDPLDLDVAPDGTVFFVERGGAVKAWRPKPRRTTLVARLDVLVAHTHGMHGIALDPRFATNHWVYLYWTPRDGPEVIRLSRFTYLPATGTIDLASEKALLEVPSQRSYNGHEGGSIDFGPDGSLYLATGDNVEPCCLGFGAIDEREGQEHDDAQRTAGNTNDLRGKILRIRPTADGGYTIPPGNLFAPGTPGTRPEIYAMGLRQPYRLHVDAGTGWVYWGDVGPDARADDPERGPRGEDEINQARTAGNYGWPYCVGDNRAYVDHDFETGTAGQPFDCAGGPVNDSPGNTGLRRLPPARPAWIHYPYDVSERWPELGSGGRAALAGPVYHDTKRGRGKGAFPAYYDNTLFIADWARNAIFEVKQDEFGLPLQINRFMPSTAFLRPIDLEFGPDGAMYLLEWGSNYGGSGRGDPNADSGLYRIAYTRAGRHAPQVRASAMPRSGKVPLTVAFSSAGTTDPDGGPLAYAWDFDADGVTDSTAPNPSHTYTARGDVVARLTVTDTAGNTAVANVPITAGNTAPVVTLVRPADGEVFDFGAQVPFEVTVADAEDGGIRHGSAGCQRVTVQPALGHDRHSHPLERYTGCRGKVATIADHGHDKALDDLFYVVDARYTDAGAAGVRALRGGDSAILQPRRKQAEHWTAAGRVMVYDTRDGGRMVGRVDDGDWLSFEPYSFAGIGSATFRVATPADGGRIELRLGSVTGTLIGSAEVGPTGGSYAFTTVTTPLTDPGGSHHLFLVFRRAPGATGLLNLDWFELNRAGSGGRPEPR